MVNSLFLDMDILLLDLLFSKNGLLHGQMILLRSSDFQSGLLSHFRLPLFLQCSLDMK